MSNFIIYLDNVADAKLVTKWIEEHKDKIAPEFNHDKYLIRKNI